MNSLHMQQNQSLSLSSANSSVGMQQGNSNMVGYNSQSTTDFNLDFLENIPGGDTSSFADQELLNSFDSDPGFNLQDIL